MLRYLKLRRAQIFIPSGDESTSKNSVACHGILGPGLALGFIPLILRLSQNSAPWCRKKQDEGYPERVKRVEGFFAQDQTRQLAAELLIFVLLQDQRSKSVIHQHHQPLNRPPVVHFHPRPAEKNVSSSELQIAQHYSQKLLFQQLTPDSTDHWACEEKNGVVGALSFFPNPRLGDRQKSCGHPLCAIKSRKVSAWCPS